MDHSRLTAAAHVLMKSWDCHPDGEMFFSHSSLLWPVVSEGHACMLKVADPDDDEAYGADMLRHYGGRGAVRLVKSAGYAQLMERIIDKTQVPTLARRVLAGEANAATHIICDVIEQLHAAPAGEPLQHLIPFDTRQETLREQVERGKTPQDRRAQYQTALSLGEELVAATKADWQPLHGDVHHDNVLHSSSRGWLAIDPKGILGPRVYEYANTLCNPYAAADIVSSPKHMERQAEIIVERSRVDKKQLLQFAFLHALQCAAWSAGGDWKEYMHAIADTAAELAGKGA